MVSLAVDNGVPVQVTPDQKRWPRDDLKYLDGKIGQWRVQEDGLRTRYFFESGFVHEVHVRPAAISGMVEVQYFEVWVDQKACLRHFSMEKQVNREARVRRQDGMEFTAHQGSVNGWRRASIDDVVKAHATWEVNHQRNQERRRGMDMKSQVADALADASSQQAGAIGAAAAEATVRVLGEQGFLRKPKGGES